MKITELRKAPDEKIGRINLHGCKLEPHEDKTIKLLALYGFDIEAVIPRSVPKANNPDIFISGMIWEMKAPTTFNEQTLKNRLKKASKQSDRLIFDLRNAKEYNETKKRVLKLFEHNHKAKRMMLITDDEKLLDIRKK